MQREVAFLAIDEIQLAADHERGHIFTDRLLHARGSEETMFLGSDTIRPDPEAAGARGRGHQPAALLDPVLRRRQQAASSAAAQRGRRLLGGRGLHAGRGAAPPEGRGRGGAGCPVAAHPQRPGRHVPGRRGRASGGHRRDRHGPQHGRGPCRFRRPRQVRRHRASPPAPARDGADRRPRRPAHGQRHASAPPMAASRSSRARSRRSRATASRR